jgi:hypothetical protein
MERIEIIMKWLERNIWHVAYIAVIVALLGEVTYLQQFKPEIDPIVESIKQALGVRFVIHLPW